MGMAKHGPWSITLVGLATTAALGATMNAGCSSDPAGVVGDVDATRPDAGRESSTAPDATPVDATASDPCPGRTTCGGVCVDTAIDRASCGACGTACADGQVCSKGQCALSCGSGTVTCSDACRDTKSDPENCGACGTTCTGGLVCSNGACALSCAGSSTKCGSACVDTKLDGANCGACGTVCGAGKVCSNGQCASGCGAGLTTCGGSDASDAGALYCANTKVDNTNCGTCGTSCDAGKVCSGGMCSATCATPLVPCGGACVDPRFDPSNCGTCGMACPAITKAKATCSSTVCGFSCDPGFLDCDTNGSIGCEIDGKTDLNHCGGCANSCAGGTCTNGTCNKYGSGTDGTATVTTSKNINTESLGASTDTNGVAPDGVAYAVSSAPSGTSIVVAGDLSSGAIAAGDRVLLINLQGIAGDTASVGKYELVEVKSVAAPSTITTVGTSRTAMQARAFRTRRSSCNAFRSSPRSPLPPAAR